MSPCHLTTQTQKDTHTMSDKNPYEIRLEILQMAKDLLYEKWNANNYALQEHYNVKITRALETESEIPAPYEPVPYPTDEDIISKARELNKFVSNG
jgi:hypothetical protein